MSRQLRNQRKFHSENLGKDSSTESNADAAETSSPDIMVIWKNTESVAGASMCKEKCILNVSGNLDINTAVVAGAVSVGIGYTKLDELLSAIDLPI
ncbi:unnamed protein product [Parnassius apollo]|uniref:(apollo) hypothetical protein n=1 Tax=Parnassius apollo TaxID=110799 RepID=A0A8S3WQB6_PARAO|nr:unnamed protein product [Parnassius apollo]